LATLLTASFTAITLSGSVQAQTYQQYEGYQSDQTGTASLFKSSPETLKKAYRVFREKSAVINLTDGLYRSTVPLVLPLKGISTVYLHPEFLSQILFPPDARITKAITSLPVKTFQVIGGNQIIIQPQKFATQGSIIVNYTLDGKKETTTIYLVVMNPYDEKGYSFKSKVFYPVVVFRNSRVLSPIEVLETYKKVYGTYPDKPYTLFSIGGVNYIIERSSIYGNVKVGNLKYLITPTTAR